MHGRNNPLVCLKLDMMHDRGRGDLQSQLSHMTGVIRLQPFTCDSLTRPCTGLLLNLIRVSRDM